MFLEGRILKDNGKWVKIYPGRTSRPLLDQVKFLLVNNISNGKGDLRELTFFKDEQVNTLVLDPGVYHHISDFNKWCKETGITTNFKRWSKEEKTLFYLNWLDDFILYERSVPMDRLFPRRRIDLKLIAYVGMVNLSISLVSYLILGIEHIEFSIGVALSYPLWVVLHLIGKFKNKNRIR